MSNDIPGTVFLGCVVLGTLAPPEVEGSVVGCQSELTMGTSGSLD